MTNEDIQWFWSTGIDLAIETVGSRPWPLSSIEGSNAVTTFKNTDNRYLFIPDFKRMYDIVVENENWDIHRKLTPYFNNEGVIYDSNTILNTYEKVLQRMVTVMGQLPKPDDYGLVTQQKIDDYVTTYLSSSVHASMFPNTTDFTTLVNTKYIDGIRWVYLAGTRTHQGQLISMSQSSNTYSNDFVDAWAMVILFGLSYGLSSWLFPPTGIIEGLVRVVGTWYVSWGVSISFPPLIAIISWLINFIISIFTGNVLQFLLESFFFLIGKILEMLVYLLLQMMEFIMWIPFIGWPFIPFYNWLRDQLFPGDVDNSSPDGDKLIIYGLFAILTGIISSYLGDTIVIDEFIYGFLLVLPSVILLYIYILFWGSEF